MPGMGLCLRPTHAGYYSEPLNLCHSLETIEPDCCSDVVCEPPVRPVPLV